MAQSTCTSSSETAQLLNINNSDEGSSHRQKSSVCPSLKHLCLPSKAAVLILFWTTSVGVLYHFFMLILLDTLLNKATLKALHSKLSILYNNPLAYAVLAVVMMFYPLSGFIADVCCGRMKTIVVSLIIISWTLYSLCHMDFQGWIVTLSINTRFNMSTLQTYDLNTFDTTNNTYTLCGRVASI